MIAQDDDRREAIAEPVGRAPVPSRPPSDCVPDGGTDSGTPVPQCAPGIQPCDPGLPGCPETSGCITGCCIPF